MRTDELRAALRSDPTPVEPDPLFVARLAALAATSATPGAVPARQRPFLEVVASVVSVILVVAGLSVAVLLATNRDGPEPPLPNDSPAPPAKTVADRPSLIRAPGQDGDGSSSGSVGDTGGAASDSAGSRSGEGQQGGSDGADSGVDSDDTGEDEPQESADHDDAVDSEPDSTGETDEDGAGPD